MNKTGAQESEFLQLQKMYDDHLAAPDIYHASKFWEKLNRLNIEWLKADGLDNFKRSVNNNYFNWMVDTRSGYFRKVARHFIAKNKYRPLNFLRLLTAYIGEMDHRTYVTANTRTSFIQRKIYAVYLLFLYEFVNDYDELSLFESLHEPTVGNPIVIERNNKKISQDISNSYLEYSFIRSSLAGRFSEIKSIAEIGGGYGRLSYLFHLLHQNEGLKIVLIDLPPALLVSQWYLQKVFPDARTMCYRNFSSFSEIEEDFNSSSMCFLLPHQLELLPEGTIDLLINVSSLQEMSRRQINRYYELIDEKVAYFYSKQWVFWENPEDKISVPAVIYPTRPNWELVSARLNPVHTEFFEALFEVKSK